MTTYNKSFQARLIGLALAMVAAGAIGLSSPVLAHQVGERGMERLAERLELTTEQADAISNLYSAHRNQVRTFDRSDESGQRERGSWRQMRESRQALNEEILSLLNEEQAEKFAAMKRHGEQRGRGHGGVFRGLDLTDEQRSEMRQLMIATREEGRPGREEFRQQMREILPEEQVAQLEARRNIERGNRGSHGRDNRGDNRGDNRYNNRQGKRSGSGPRS